MSRKGRYTGTLTPSEALIGMRCCLGNAMSLVEEAMILAEHERYPRAIALSLIAWEELGKLPMLQASPRYGSDAKEWKKGLWKRFRNHVDKLFLQEHVFPTQQSSSPAAPLSMLPIAEVRERMLYADHNGSAFESPEDIDGLAHVANDLITHLANAINFHEFMVSELDEDEMVLTTKLTPAFFENARQELKDAGHGPVQDIEILRALEDAGLDAKKIWDEVKRRSANA